MDEDNPSVSEPAWELGLSQKLFRNSPDLRTFLETLDMGNESIEEVVEHEEAHFQKGRELGGTPYYKVFFSNIINPPKYAFAVVMLPGVRNEDYPLVAMAPENPSEVDKKKAGVAS